MHSTINPVLLLASLSWHNINLTPKEFLQLLKNYKKHNFKIENTWEYLPTKAQNKLKNKAFWWQTSSKQIQWSIDQGIKFSYPGHEHYPLSLFQDLNHSPLLSYIGKPLSKYERPLLAIIGSRKPDKQSLDWMDAHLSPFIKNTNTNCISGGARGIDQHSHKISICNNSPSIAFIPTGFKTIYPSSFKNYIPEIIKSGGTIVSLFSPDTPLFKYNFHKRNLLIASLASHIFMVIGQKKSGSLLTAKLGIDLNKDVGTIPQAPWSAFTGNIDLIAQGAQVLSSKEDLHTWVKIF